MTCYRFCHAEGVEVDAAAREDAAGAILNAELDAERNRKLADDFIASLPDARN